MIICPRWTEPDEGTDGRKFVRGGLIHTAALVVRVHNSSSCIPGILQDKIWPFTGSMPTVYLQLFYRTGSTVPFDLPQIQIRSNTPPSLS